ncbi:hypothetical protein [Mycobacterium sp. MUNTM1]
MARNDLKSADAELPHSAESINALATLIREVDGSHTLGAAALAETLVVRGVTITAREQWAYAVATRNSDASIRALSQSFATPREAEHELAVLPAESTVPRRTIARYRQPPRQPVEAICRNAEEIETHEPDR